MCVYFRACICFVYVFARVSESVCMWVFSCVHVCGLLDVSYPLVFLFSANMTYLPSAYAVLSIT